MNGTERQRRDLVDELERRARGGTAEPVVTIATGEELAAFLGGR